jgi:hypothetical protein
MPKAYSEIIFALATLGNDTYIRSPPMLSQLALRKQKKSQDIFRKTAEFQ